VKLDDTKFFCTIRVDVSGDFSTNTQNKDKVFKSDSIHETIWSNVQKLRQEKSTQKISRFFEE
jgi:hypothetical protein